MPDMMRARRPGGQTDGASEGRALLRRAFEGSAYRPGWLHGMATTPVFMTAGG
jgi:hypothetical protein